MPHYAYYNEIDAQKAQWLRELIAARVIAPGTVDTRSIEVVEPGDLEGFTQCHFFAGIGVWSYALRCAGWPDSREIWTGSCPCQPFSVAGKRAGKADRRHLWPELLRLIAARKPVVVTGEQVASKDGLAWFDDVQVGLADEDYTVGCADTPAAGHGAPHLRQRFYWVAVAAGIRQQRGWPSEAGCGQQTQQQFERFCDVGGDGRSTVYAVDHSASPRRGPVNGYWSDAIWLPCTDGKYRAVERIGVSAAVERPTEPSPFVLADGTPADLGRVRYAGGRSAQSAEGSGANEADGVWLTHPLIVNGKARTIRLRGFGDAIVAPQATEFIRAVMNEIDDQERGIDA